MRVSATSLLSLAISILTIADCSGGGSGTESTQQPPPPANYTIGGTLSGLSGTGLVLQNNGGGDLSTANGSFTFGGTVVVGSNYAVTVKTQPTSPSQTCSVTNGAGVANGNVTSVTVNCVTNAYSIGGTVSGLLGTLVLRNGTEQLTVTTNGAFTFPTKVASGANYLVSVFTQPSFAQNCAIQRASGTVQESNVTNVAVSCPVPCGAENGTVVNHSTNVTANETWAGDGTVHLIPTSINILAPAIVTIQKCAIVKLKAGVVIDVRGDPVAGIAKLVTAGDSITTGAVTFTSADTLPWGRIRGINSNSLIELNNTVLTQGGNVGGAQRNAMVVATGSSTLPDPVLKMINVEMRNGAGAGIYLSNAAFTSDSVNLFVYDMADYPLALTAMALGSIPLGQYGGAAGNEALVVENVNIFDNLTIRTTTPIHFKTDSVHVGGLAPTFVQNLTLTLEAGVTLRFEGLTAPTLVTFGDIGQSINKNAALVTHGDSYNPVVFTSGKANPQPGDWAGIWLMTSNGSQLDHAVFDYAGGDASIGPTSCGPFDSSINQKARNTAPLIVGDDDTQFLPPANLITNSLFRKGAGNYAIDAVWLAGGFGPDLTLTNVFEYKPKFCLQNKNLKTLGCSVSGVDQSGCQVPVPP
jgi:hypothetical protein